MTTGRGSILPAARVSRAPASGRVSIIIPTRDRADLLERCLASIRPARERHGCELLIVDNGSSDPVTRALLAAVRAEGGRVLADPGPFNYARLCNRAVEAVTGDVVLFLNNDVEMGGDGWLPEMLGRLADPSVEAVGAVLRWPSGVVQHGGVVLGPGFSASHAFDDRFQDDPGYGDLLRVAHQPSAVTGACLLVRRASYRAVGGMDTVHFPVNFNDIDLCLKLGARGGNVVLTPHLDAVHLGSASRGSDRRPDQRARYARELAALRARWGDVLQADPAYSPLLALSDNPYTALACPPRTLTPRERQIGAGRHIPNGL
ncbi:MAG: glycosyltransferase [Hyphomicrobiales bacterium]